MEKYNEHKETNVFWQTMMPKHWCVMKLRYILRKLQREKKPNAELLVCSNSGRVNIKGDNKLGLVAEDDKIYQGVGKGDLLIHGMDTWHGAIAVSEYDGMCTPVVHVCDSTQNKSFVAYYLRNMAYEKVFKLISNGVRQNTSDFRCWDKLAVVPIILPPLAEQNSIVSYLDTKCSQLDTLLSNKEKQISLLQEMKQRVIADAVTRGVNPNVKFKATNISWLPEIPEHWEEKRLSSKFVGEVETNKEFEYKHAFKFNYGELLPKNELGDQEEYRDVYVKYSIINKGDILINGLNLNYDFVSQRVACAPNDGIITSAYVVCRPRNGVNYNYYKLLLKAMDSMKLFHGMGSGIRLTLSFKELKKQILPVPPLSEQCAIVSYITERTSKIDALIEKLTKEIECIKEYKQRLISDVVTGQVKVS